VALSEREEWSCGDDGEVFGSCAALPTVTFTLQSSHFVAAMSVEESGERSVGEVSELEATAGVSIWGGGGGTGWGTAP
jgi:hypothetical protein